MILKVLALKMAGIFRKSIVDDIIVKEDNQGFENVKRLAKQEGLLVGSSSGAALQGALDIKRRIDKGIIVTIFPDGTSLYVKKYLNTKENNNEEKHK